MATISWKNSADGNWSIASNWTPGTVPGSADIAQITIGGTYNVLFNTNRTLAGLTLGTTTGIQTLDLTSGYTLTLNGASTVSNNGVLNLTNGTLTGTGALTVSGTGKFNWSGGTLKGTGKKTVSGILNLSDYPYLDGTTLETSGTTVWTGNGYLYGYNNAIWNNTSTGTIDLQGDADLYWWYGNGNQPTFNNAGTFTKSNGTTTDESYIGFIFNNTGTVQVKTGTLRIAGGGSNSGAFSIDSGATLKLNSDYNFNTGTNITGLGNFVVESGTVKIIPAFNYSGAISLTGGTLDLGTNSTWSAPVTLSYGTLTGAGALTISNQLNWSGGTLSGTGKKTVSGILNLSDSQSLDGKTLETSGTTIWTGNGYLYGSNNAIWNNTSTGKIDLQGDADLSMYFWSGEQNTFNNAGTFTKSNGTTTDESYIGFIFNNTGTVQVKKGTLNLSGGGSNSGTFSIDSGATLNLYSDYNFNAGTNITGLGNFVVENYTVKIIPAFNYSGAISLTGGTLDLGTNSTWSAPVTLSGATLTGTGAVTITNKLNWSSGTLSGTGKKTVSGILNLSDYPYLDGTTLETSGTTVWTGNGHLSGYNNAIWNNTSTGTIDLQGDADLYWWYGNSNQPTFNNAGTFTKSNGINTDESQVDFIFNNTGTVDIKKGKLTFTSDYTQTAGTTRLNGGSLTLYYSPLNLQGGTLVGAGTITGSVNNTGGQINPGNTIGTLNIAGDYSQSGTGTLNLELSNATTFDKLAITGAADIGGILKLNLNGSYTPTIGTKFTVLTYGSATTKGFSSIEGIDISSGLAFAPTSTGKNLTLEVVDQVQNLGSIVFSSPQTITDFVGDTDKFDFYRFNFTSASNIQLKLSNLTANANVWLVDGLGRTIAQGIKAGTADEFVSSFVDAGTYYVKVFQGATGNNTNYSLQLSSSTNSWPVQDGGYYDDYVNSVSNDSTGNIYATGYGYDYDHGNIDAGIVKYSPDGTQTWYQQFTSTGNDYAYGVGNDSSGNVYSTGYTDGTFAGNTNKGFEDAFLTKYNTNGTQAWVKQFGTAADDYAYGISVDGSGNSYVVGATWGTFASNTTQGAYDAFIAKYDTNGTQTWVKQFGTSYHEQATSVIFDSSTNTILVTGDTYGSFAGSTNLVGTDIFVSKYDINGTQTWVKQLGTNDYDYDYSTGISSDSTGNIYVAGYTSYGAFAGNTNKGYEDGFIAKYSTTGTLAWVKQFGTTSSDYLRAVKSDSAGNTYVVGQTYGTFAGNTSLGGWDSFIAKYNTNGTQLWVKQFGTNSDDDATALSLDNQGNIYVSGRTYGSFPTYTNQGSSDGYIAVFDTNGNQLSVPITSTVVPPNVTLSVSPISVTEDGANNLVYTFTRTGSTVNELTVRYNIGGTADSADYTGATPGTEKTITFAANASTAILTIDPTADTTVELDETVEVTLLPGTGTSATNYTVGTTTGVVGTITNDDVVAPSVTINLSNKQTVVEGLTNPQNVTYTVNLSGASTQPITVQYATADIKAKAGSDYTSTSGTLTFNPGETSKTISIPILNNSVNEVNETFTLTLSNPTNASLATVSSVVTTITDTLTASSTTTLPIGVENLTLTGTSAINGTGNANANILKGNSKNNTLAGLGGNDSYVFLANAVLGTDTINEAVTSGTDLIDFTGTKTGVNVNLETTTLQTVNSYLNLVLSANNVIENVTGGLANDVLTGNSLDNTLFGGNGDDQLVGQAGNDLLWGAAGNDTLTGGTGVDKYQFKGSSTALSTSLGVDLITQFVVGEDQILLSKSTFKAITNIAGQVLTDFAVVADNSLVNGSNARMVYSQGTGSLFYNQDGNVLGTSTVFEIARLGNLDITLSGSDFLMVA